MKSRPKLVSKGSSLPRACYRFPCRFGEGTIAKVLPMLKVAQRYLLKLYMYFALRWLK